MRRVVGIVVIGALLMAVTTAGAVADPTGDTFNPGIDLTELRACHGAMTLVIHLAFADDIVPASDGPPPANALYGYVDIDLDRNAATGDLSNTDQHGPPGAGTELGIEAYVTLTDWDPADGTVSMRIIESGMTVRVPATFTARGVRIEVPLAAPLDGGANLGTVIGTFDEPTDVAPNTGFVTSDPCCGNGEVDAGEPCDGGACCTGTCTAVPDGTVCSDGDACTTTDACSAGACTGPAATDCDDGDPCFDDTCDAAGGCAHTDRAGLPGLSCVFERSVPTLCSGQSVDTAKLDKAEALVGQAVASTKTKKRTQKLKKAGAALKAMRKRVDRAQKRDALTIECADGLRAQLDDASARLARALSGG